MAGKNGIIKALPIFSNFVCHAVFFILTLCFELFPKLSQCQWTRLSTFEGAVSSIHFLDKELQPLTGFIGITKDRLTQNKLWKTIDGGYTWKAISYLPNAPNGYPTPHNFSFKNQLEGWWCGWFETGFYRTVDGGNTWELVPTMSNWAASGMYYLKSLNKLICSDGTPFFYTTDNVTFQQPPVRTPHSTISVSFSDDLHGIFSYTNPWQGMAYTTDGGITWVETLVHSEFFQPVGIPNSQTFFAISEACIPDPSKAGTVVRSDDGGVTWKELYKYPIFGNDLVTGMMQAGKNMSLFFQTTTDGSEGIMMSLDSGKTFTSMCGPVNFEDTRFYVRDTFIYAGDKYGGLWLNSTGIGSNSTPQLSKNSISLDSRLCQ